MRMKLHTVKTPTILQSAYGENIRIWGNPQKVLMFIAWNNRAETEDNGALYTEYEYVALTKVDVPVGALIDSMYEVGDKDRSGRFIRLFMKKTNGRLD